MSRIATAFRVLCGSVCAASLLAGCAFEPHEYPKLAPPRSGEIVPLFKSDPVVALVLGAGGARGFAHIGVIKVLEAAGIQPAVVVGSSAGAVVAALYAGGLDARRLESMALDLNDYQLIDFTLFGPSRIQ